MPRALVESRPLEISEATGSRSGQLDVCLITPGWGSSGYYSVEVLEAAATAGVFHAGTQMFLDHPTETERTDRPERSLKDLAAVLTEDATWDGQQLTARVQAFPTYRPLLTDHTFTESIGVSIRANGSYVTGEAEGRRGPIITELTEAKSVDFVTQAGRGGRILEVLESSRPSVVVARAVGHGVEEATANDTREALQQALRDGYGGDRSWVWVRDFDGTTVWYEHETEDASGTYAEDYTLSDNGGVTLAGQRTEVRARTEYVPVTASESAEEADTMPDQPNPDTPQTDPPAQRPPADQPQGTPTPAEQPAPQTPEQPAPDTAGQPAQTRAEEARMPENSGAGSGAAPTRPREVMEQRYRNLEERYQQLAARDAARDIIAAELAEAWVAPSTITRLTGELMGRLPIVNGNLDEAALRTLCVEARDTAEFEAAEVLNASGVGSPRGLGALTHPADGRDSVERYTSSIEESLKVLGLSDEAAKSAAKGR